MPRKEIGTVILDKFGQIQEHRSVIRNFFGALLNDRDELHTAEHVAYWDRENPGLAPHRLEAIFIEAPVVVHGKVEVPDEVRSNAQSIRHQNYKTNTPKQFQKHQDVHTQLKTAIAAAVHEPEANIDFVYFSVAQGAQEHVDALNPDVFTSRTFIVPVILPEGSNYITAQGQQVEVSTDLVYEINHELPHSMQVANFEEGAVVIMASLLK